MNNNVKEIKEQLVGVSRDTFEENAQELITYISDDVKAVQSFMLHEALSFPFDDCKNSSIAIVGNSPIILNNEYGEFIDSHDYVFRFNDSKTEGFEKHTGKRCNFRMVNGHHVNMLEDEKYYKKHLEAFPEASQRFLDTLENCNLFLKTDASFKLKTDLPEWYEKITSKNTLFTFTKYFEQFLHDRLGQYGACGMYSVMFASWAFKEVNCFGFNFYKEDETSPDNVHYYEKSVRDEGRIGTHQFDNEEIFFNLLEKNNLIKVYR